MDITAFKHWLLTWTCHGQWLPGDRRGFVGHVRQADGTRTIHNRYGTPCDADMPALEEYIRQRMAGPPVTLSRHDAETVMAQMRETAEAKAWRLEAASVAFNHVHVVVGLGNEEDSRVAMTQLKAWGTRALKRTRPMPAGGSFWTAKGSRRCLTDAHAIRAAVRYVAEKQKNALAVWRAEEG